MDTLFERLNQVPELRQKQRACVVHHNLNVVILLLVVMLTFFGSIHLGRSAHLDVCWIFVPIVSREWGFTYYCERTGYTQKKQGFCVRVAASPYILQAMPYEKAR